MFVTYFLGLQGSLLGSIIEPIYINSITQTNDYSPEDLVRALCCRFERGDRDEDHPWIQRGVKFELKNHDVTMQNQNKNVSIYWTHGDMGKYNALCFLQ